MRYKSTTLYFLFQSLKYAKSPAHFRQIWSYFPPWKSALEKGRNSVADEQAWINFEALSYLRSWLKNEHKVFEYGGGGSTLFFARYCRWVATVENDEEWFKVLSAKIKEKGIDYWQGFFQRGEIVLSDKTRHCDNPEDFLSKTPGQENLSYELYARKIEQFPDESLDLVLVDGRARPSCIAQSVAKIKPGGLLVVDNMERDYYHTAFDARYAQLFEPVVSGRYPTPYHPDFTDTSVFRKR